MKTQYINFQDEWRVCDDDGHLVAVYWALHGEKSTSWFVRVAINGTLTEPHKCVDDDMCVAYLKTRLAIQALEDS